MLSIHYNYGAKHVHRNLQMHSKSNANVMEKLASGFRINKGADGPADLMISEQLRSQIDGLERAIQNTEESNNLMAIMEGAMSQVTEVLRRMKDLALHSANGITSPEQVGANQAEMDAALHALNRIFNSTNVGGRKILDNMMIEGRVPTNTTTLTPANVVATPENIDRDSLYTALINGENLDGRLMDNKLVGNDGLLKEDRTLILTGMGENGDQEVQVNLRQGDSLDSILAQLAPYQQEVAGYATPPGGGNVVDEIRQGDDASTIHLSAATLHQMAGMGDNDAKSFLGNFLGGIHTLTLGQISEIDFTKMSEEDLALYNLSQDMQGMKLGTMGGLETITGYDAFGNAMYGTLSLQDLWSGGKASLAENPQKAMEIIDQAMKDALAQRASIGAAIAMSHHSVDNMRTTHENLVRTESAIRDTDMAEAMVEFTRTQLLTNVGTQLLGQFHKQHQQILDLIA